jgi:transmembrane sensor
LSRAEQAQCAPESLAEAAARWDARLRSPDCTDADRLAFAAWLGEDSSHRQAFERLQVALRSLQAAAAADPQLRAVRDRARGATRAHARRFGMAASLAAVLLIGGAGVGVYVYKMPGAETASVYRTAPGERSTLRLGDGSVVVMNSRTELQVAYGKHRRSLTLVSGEAMFDVATDADRPFSVRAGRREVIAVGTAFGVRLDPRELRVVMIEGKVKVAPAGPWKQRPAEQILVGGQRMTAAPNALEVEVGAADLTKDTAWLEDRVIFDGETLKVAVEEINRHTERPIRIGDASLSALRISGMFKTTQPEKFLDALTAYYPISTVTNRAGDTVLYRK